MSLIKSKVRIPALTLLCAVIVMFPVDADCYDVDADFLSPGAFLFPVGQFVSGDLSNASQMDFTDIAPLFWLHIREDAAPQDDPDEAIIMVRLEEAGSGVIFTVSSQAVNIRTALIRRGRMTNSELALIPELHIGAGGQFNANNLFPYIDGGLMRSGDYILTLLIADPQYTISDWDQVLNDNHGIHSAVFNARAPSRVELDKPYDGSKLSNNPIFSWLFPRAPGLVFNLLLVSGESNQDPSTALDFANEQTTFLNLDITLPPSASGEISSHAYTGTGRERPLAKGGLYFWRITAEVPTAFGGTTILDSKPYSFTYGDPLPQEVRLVTPMNGSVIRINPPEFRWRFPQYRDLYFEISVLTSEGNEYAKIGASPPAFTGDFRMYRYGSGIEKELVEGDYSWTVKATVNLNGVDHTIESEVRGFTYIPASMSEKTLADSLVIQLHSPEDGGTVKQTKPEYRWSSTLDASSYRLLVYVQGREDSFIDQEFDGRAVQRQSIVDQGKRTDMIVVKPDVALESGGSYEWKIIAVGSEGVETESAIAKFEVE